MIEGKPDPRGAMNHLNRNFTWEHLLQKLLPWIYTHAAQLQDLLDEDPALPNKLKQKKVAKALPVPSSKKGDSHAGRKSGNVKQSSLKVCHLPFPSSFSSQCLFSLLLFGHGINMYRPLKYRQTLNLYLTRNRNQTSMQLELLAHWLNIELQGKLESGQKKHLVPRVSKSLLIVVVRSSRSKQGLAKQHPGRQITPDPPETVATLGNIGTLLFLFTATRKRRRKRRRRKSWWN
jgi:hypothetical protein